MTAHAGRELPPPVTASVEPIEGLGGTLSAVGKVMVVLDCFRDTNRHLRLSDITRRTGLPSSTAHRVLNELSAWHALERTPNGYRVGVRMFGIGSAVQTQDRVYEAATPIMQEVLATTGENVHLSMLDGAEVVFVLKLTGQRSFPILTRPGGRLPAHATASGRVMLAHSSPEVIEAVMRGARQKLTRNTLADTAALMAQLKEARVNGYVTSVGEVSIGSTSVAAPVFDWNGDVLAALSVVGDSISLDHRRLAPRVRSAALALTRRILQLVTTPGAGA